MSLTDIEINLLYQTYNKNYISTGTEKIIASLFKY